MPLTPQDVQERTFGQQKGLGKRGYDETEVDDFLDEVFEEMTRLIRINEECAAQLAQTRSQVVERRGSGPYAPRDPERRVAVELVEFDIPTSDPQPVAPDEAPTPTSKAAAAAERPAEPAAPAEPERRPEPSPAEAATGILALAQRTADDYVSQAHERADALLSDAREQAERMAVEADDHKRETLGALDTERGALEAKVEELRAFEREYRSRLRAYLESQLQDLEGRPDVELSVGTDTDARPDVVDGAPRGDETEQADASPPADLDARIDQPQQLDEHDQGEEHERREHEAQQH